ncbi:carbohydrate ABC transporter permease [Rhodobacteraceae bacterium HSP-20]|uniref:Carbohydrate ABC transporter permease n=1 Tax=Paragemmobacter amnigenus TaxID=2852097 RepID=A0ABS6JC73_9RHOB|nr:carbohydrate ABC transporter permease [Rhodobacter amnigenus]MBU9699975.1 carbohydrate ABC transporter permease [Rhodobacter amnigenus]MBV4391202.1 carbohydrate ABC transporter permease [Rhodobacter amnigenus]
MIRAAGLLALALFILLPLAQAVMLSFVVTLPKDGLAEGAVGLMNYAAVLAAPELRAAMVNSAVYVVLNLLLCIAVALPAAYALARYRFVGDRHFLLLILVFRVTPPVVLSLPIFILFSKLGLVNSPVGIALVHCLFNLPVAIWILESFIRAVPRALDETAFLDGHSGASFFFRHLIPAIAPGIGVAAFFCFIFSWVEVVFARILTVTAGKPVTMAISAMFGFQTDMGMVMAMTCLSLLPGLGMIWLVRNHLARGFTLRA